ncbi:uncharacterized protein LOC125064242 [Vanessa atalanta]|uniref:uncharacterized protein LOC125064242 n=1 Tax=Vanessa atalanta TaxID=42275 RepID=UPI001FCD68A6|nr:uncharacterized protein LOC125064242 [Vanessa atalanta]
MLETVFIKIMVAILVLNKQVYSAGDIHFSHENKKQDKFRVSTNTRHMKTSELQVEIMKQYKFEKDKLLSKKTNTYIKISNKTSNNQVNTTEKTAPNKTSLRHHVLLLHQNPNKYSIQLARIPTNLQTSTPSYIEFHYFDNSENVNIYPTRNFVNNYKIAFLRPPLFLIRLNDAVCHTPSENFMILSKKVLSNTIKFSRDNHAASSKYLIKPLHDDNTKYRQYTLFTNSPKVNNGTCAYKTSTNIYKNANRNILSREINDRNRSSSISTEKDSRKFESTTAYDRIKFFEIYDNNTDPPRSLSFNEKNDELQSNYYRRNANVNLNKENNSVHTTKSHYITRSLKKYVTPNDTKRETPKYVEKYSSTSTSKINNPNAIPISTNFPCLSKSASWSEFPFVAVYTYEPAQVHCDCASISSHWLVSSATCLYLHHKDLRIDGRSAFVSYCSNHWRRPGRIAYVRRSLLHPRFKPTDKIRRQVYNIGVIQVASSMANTCNGWQPISLMSHQFVAGPDGTLATAVGWGLDRYDTRHSTSELPLHPLMLYQSLVFSDSCPGNSGYSNAKLFNEESVKNVYCLSLPPYIKEENDTVHGSLLLVGGKLIALYLQEERRPWGVQSAQYTSIWRLIPWLLDVAQEIDEQDPLDAEI